MKTRVALGLVLVAATLAPASLITAARAGGGGLPVHNITTGTDYATIQEAINAAVGGDEIEVDPGTYVERINMLGKAITLRSVDGAATTIIDGSDGGTVVTCGSGEGSDTVLRGFTMTGGRAVDGGGMNISGSGPTVVDCIFQGNRATDSPDSRGAGMYIHQGSPLVMGCTFIDNTVGEGTVITAYGGGAFLSDSNATVLDCVFAGNSAVANLLGTDAVARGGGIYSVGGDTTVINTTFSGNSAWSASVFPGSTHAYGGGIASEAGTLTVTNCTFAGNSASTINELNAWGGGVHASGGATTVTNCVFHANTAHVEPQDVYGSASVSYSCLQDSHPGTGNIVADPLLVDADGPDNTYGTADDDLHLLIDSPCVDTGDDTALPADTFDQDHDGDHSESLPQDFEGDPRVADADGDSTPTVDMGADEHWFDCNDNGLHDARDIAEGTSPDCNGNEVPDECDMTDGTSPDCNTNDTPDECDITAGTSLDCNANAIPDECEPDPDGDGVPEECEAIQNVTQDTWHGTIQLAINHATAGDEIEVSPGTYHERINLLGKVITLSSTDGPDVTVIDGDGGGTVITCESGEGPDTIIDGFTVTGGDAQSGGGMRNWQSSPTLINCFFSGNSASSAGGGMRNSFGSPTLIDCTFAGNSALHGGGMENGHSSPTLINCTFAGNSAYSGGGLHHSFDNGSVALTNCILWGNSAPVGSQIYEYDNATTTATYTCAQGGWAGVGNLSVAPLFVDADGPDGVPGTPDDNLRLQAGSPCIDAGLSASTLRDLDGNQRIVDDPGTADTGIGFPDVIDMGPYEFGSTPPEPCSADLDGDGDVDLLDFGSFQAQFTGPQ